jgi:RNA polymerase subunit RPABC4/transcription elongation factor Spt4
LPLSETERLILVAVLATLMTFVVLFEMRIMRSKSREARAASQKKDEAFNAVLTTRSVLNAVRNRGGRVGNAPALLDRAKEAMGRGKYDSCVELCDKAKSELTKPSSPPAQPLDDEEIESRDRLEAVAESIVSTRTLKTEGDTYKGTKLEGQREGNYLGAKFEISAAKADIGKASYSGVDISVADGLMVEAESAYTAGNYDKALSLAVRARKAACASIEGETIPLKVDEEEPAPEAKVYEVKEETAKAPTNRLCRDCGAVLDKDDVFCPICGAKVKTMSCPSCGAKTKPDDKFCRKCGTKIG